MTWVLLIQILTVSTCQVGARFCPPAHPPVEQRQPFATEAQCEARAEAYRQVLPVRRTLVHRVELTMEQQTTVRCVAQVKREGRPR
jgi:hypothetical protein